jgi:hypothetical protein
MEQITGRQGRAEATSPLDTQSKAGYLLYGKDREHEARLKIGVGLPAKNQELLRSLIKVRLRIKCSTFWGCSHLTKEASVCKPGLAARSQAEQSHMLPVSN